MADMHPALALGWTRPDGHRPHRWRRYMQGGSERTWTIAFVVPYVAVLLVFAVYPVAYGLWMASEPSLYAELFSSDEYGDAVVTTLLYVGVGVNVTMFLALLLSGFFMRRRWWIKALLVLSMLPWALPAQPAFISFHWMLIYPGFHRCALLEPVRRRRPGLVQQLLAGARRQHPRLRPGRPCRSGP